MHGEGMVSPPRGDATVILIHGWPDDGSLWRHQVPLLEARGWRVVTVNCHAMLEGFSPHEDDQRGNQRHIKHLYERLLDGLNLRDAHIVSHGLGALAAWEIAAAAPRRVRSLCVLCVGHAGEIIVDLTTGLSSAYAWMLPQLLGKHVGAWYTRGEAKHLRQLLHSHPECLLLVDAMCERARQAPALAWRGANGWIKGLVPACSSGYTRPRIEVPTLAIRGERDCLFPEGQLLRSGLRVDGNWRYRRVSGGHWAPLDGAAQVNELLEAWIVEQGYRRA